MPPPPPRAPPPPGPGPPPAPAFAFQAAKPPPAPLDRSAVLLDIQKGARLKKVDRSEIKDRSSPLVLGAAGPSASSSDASLSSGSGPGRTRPYSSSSTTSSMSPQAALGGLFANGMPTLKRTGLRQVGKGSPTEDNNTTPSSTRKEPSVIPQQPKPSPPPPPAAPSQLHTSSSSTAIKPVAPPPKPANLQPQQRRSMEFEKPVLSPKPANFNQITSGSATVHIQRKTERPSIPMKMNTVPPQKPKHPPPPLPTNPPPTRNISQTMPRPSKHQRPSLPAEVTNSGKLNGSPPTPPPVPGRPPSFRKTNEARPSIQPPPPAIFPAGSSQQAPVVHQAPYRAGGPIAPQPPPSASTTTLPFSASLHSLPGSPASAQRPGPPRRHDSLNSVLQQQQIDHTLRNVPQKTVQSPQPPRQPKMTLAQEFEAKFCFHPISELPSPMPFSGLTKTYPSAKTRSGTRPTAPAPPVR